MGNFKETIGISELRDKKDTLWKAILAEFVGNFLLNFFGCASVVSFGDSGHSLVLISLTFGFAIFIIVHVSSYYI